MEKGILVHQCNLQIGDRDYEIAVYSRPDGNHVARTVLGPGDVIINDGITCEEVLAKHQRLLPLAINSRQILREFRLS
jgi:hypothetical protein